MKVIVDSRKVSLIAVKGGKVNDNHPPVKSLQMRNHSRERRSPSHLKPLRFAHRSQMTSVRDTVISLFLGFLAHSFTSPLCPRAYASHSPYRPPSCVSSQCPASSSISVDTSLSSNYGSVLNRMATPIAVGATITQNMSTTATKCA